KVQADSQLGFLMDPPSADGAQHEGKDRRAGSAVPGAHDDRQVKREKRRVVFKPVIELDPQRDRDQRSKDRTGVGEHYGRGLSSWHASKIHAGAFNFGGTEVPQARGDHVVVWRVANRSPVVSDQVGQPIIVRQISMVRICQMRSNPATNPWRSFAKHRLPQYLTTPSTGRQILTER